MLLHYICRVDVGDRYEANSRETFFEDLGPVWQANFCKVTPCSLWFVRFSKLHFVRCAKRQFVR